MSSKEIGFGGNNVVPSEDHDFRISMKNLRLRDDYQKEEHITENHQVSLRGKRSQLVDGLPKQAKDALKQFELCAAHPEEAAISHKLFETISSFHVKQCTTRKV